jgi:hypothetical protein
MMKEKEKAQGPFRLSDPDFRNAELAIRRAAVRARERARRFGHGIVIYKDGKIIEKPVTREQRDE